MKMLYGNIIRNYKNINSCISRTQTQRIFLFILFFSFGGLILSLNILYPIYGDDWRYSFISDSSLSVRVSSLSDSIHSQSKHYFGHGGRSIVHIIAESLLQLDRYWMDIFNSISYLALVYIIYKIANLNNKINASLFFFINILIWFFQPAFGQTLLWITGSANYLWGTLIIISFLYFYCNAFILNSIDDSILRRIIFLIFGIIAGWTNENSVIGMIFIILSIILCLKLKKTRIPKWMIYGLIGTIIGFIIMIIAPGNFVRFDKATTSNFLLKDYKLIYYYTRMLPVLAEFYKNILPLVLIHILVLINYIHLNKKQNKTIISLSLIFCIAGVISDLVMIASPEFSLRVLFAPIIFYIIAIGLIYSNIRIESLYFATIRNTLIFFSIIYLIPLYIQGYKDVSNFNRIMNDRESTIKKQENKANFEFISYERFTPKTKFTMMYDMSPDRNEWDNMCYSKYHNIKSFKVETDK